MACFPFKDLAQFFLLTQGSGRFKIPKAKINIKASFFTYRTDTEFLKISTKIVKLINTILKNWQADVVLVFLFHSLHELSFKLHCSRFECC